MKENWPYIFLVGVLSLAFIAFLIRQNSKDQKQLEKKLNEDYHKTKDEENDVDTEDTPK
ncbi:MAG: hypothetical protein JNK98_10010 [Chitinophagaceae bacterium]|nr:hypothetical protein [Chitinophagaceae bacterium]